MKKIEPTHKEIMQYLNCCHYSKYNKKQCTCYMKSQFRDCYESAKRLLTRTVLTDAEIKQAQKRSRNIDEELKKALTLLHEEY